MVGSGWTPRWPRATWAPSSRSPGSRFNYFISEAVFDYIVDAVHLLADEGWKLLPLYRFDPDTGLWRHRAAMPDPPPSLRDLTAALDGGRAPVATAPESVLPGQLEAAREVIAAVQRAARPPARCYDPELSDEFERIRWFPLPGEGLAQLLAVRPRARCLCIVAHETCGSPAGDSLRVSPPQSAWRRVPAPGEARAVPHPGSR